MRRRTFSLVSDRRPRCSPSPPVSPARGRPVAALLLILAGLAGAGAARAAASPEAGVVVEVTGRPLVLSGTAAGVALDFLHVLHQGDRVALQARDKLLICLERAGKAVEVEGPGSVVVGAASVQGAEGQPRIAASGRCDSALDPGVNGGLVLRKLTPGVQRR